MTSPSGGPPRAVISVCTSCRAAGSDANPGEALLSALRAAQAAGRQPDVLVRPVQCLSVCKRPCTASLSAAERYTYVFGDLDPLGGAEALLDCARLYIETEHGYLLWRERPEPLRRGIVARIPPPDWLAPDGGHPR